MAIDHYFSAHPNLGDIVAAWEPAKGDDLQTREQGNASPPNEARQFEDFLEMFVKLRRAESAKRHVPQLGTVSMSLLSIAVVGTATVMFLGFPFTLVCFWLAWPIAAFTAFTLTCIGAVAGICAIFSDELDSSEQLLGEVGCFLNTMAAVWLATKLF